MTAKTRAIPGLHREKFLAKVPGRCPVLRQVPLTNYTAGPLGFIAFKINTLRNFFMIYNLHFHLETSIFTKFRVTLPACSDAHLHMAIHGLAFLKFVKPALEYFLQDFPTLRKPCYVPSTGTEKLRNLTASKNIKPMIRIFVILACYEKYECLKQPDIYYF